MSGPAPFVGSGWLWRLEARLARLTGRDRWPAIEARTYSKQVPVNLRTYDGFTTFLAFGWTVKGEPYATILRASFIQPEALLHELGTTILQYKPSRPGRIYYAPQRMLARAFLAAVLVGFLVSGVVITVFVGTR